MTRRGARNWPTIVLSVASALLFVGGAVLMNGLVLSSAPAPARAAPLPPPQAANASAGPHQPTL